MGTHPIFESDFDCLTDLEHKMPETKKVEDKAKREEFRRYLDQAGIVDQLTQFLVSLYEEPEKPTDAVGYMKKALGNGPDAADVESLRVKIEELSKKLEEANNRADEAEAKVAELQSKVNEQAPNEEAPAEEAAAE